MPTKSHEMDSELSSDTSPRWVNVALRAGAASELVFRRSRADDPKRLEVVPRKRQIDSLAAYYPSRCHAPSVASRRVIASGRAGRDAMRRSMLKRPIALPTESLADPRAVR